MRFGQLHREKFGETGRHRRNSGHPVVHGLEEVAEVAWVASAYPLYRAGVKRV